MSYVRWGQGGSDLYIYMDVNGNLCCCGCPMPKIDMLGFYSDDYEASYYAPNTKAMIQHLFLHQDRGDCFPSDVIPRIQADDKRNFPDGESNALN